ncbi:MAG: UbiX family flavin prenyltransferase [Cohaesibacter sp.]|jgi:4-hydroxy-3-polyprenylbenzoate decarboxylase|nr:UbiX family flavin prenyltransferase [Cohaesibacter sp.]
MTAPRKLGIVLSGASGSLLALQALRLAHSIADWESHLIITEGGQRTAELELNSQQRAEITALADHIHQDRDLAATIASGSNALDAMAILPCSIRSLSAIAYGQTDRLSIRAADVMLKERKPLVLAVRESPLHAGHLNAMSQVTQMGGIIAPPVPAFYLGNLSIEDMTRQMAARILQLLGLDVKDQRQAWEPPG